MSLASLGNSPTDHRPTNADRLLRCVLALPAAVIRASASLVPPLPSPSPIPSPSLSGSHRPGRKADQAGGVTANFSCQNERDVSGIVSPPFAANKTDEAALNFTRNRFYPSVPIESRAFLHTSFKAWLKPHTDAQICLSVAVSRLFRSFDFGLRHEQGMGMISVDLS